MDVLLLLLMHAFVLSNMINRFRAGRLGDRAGRRGERFLGWGCCGTLSALVVRVVGACDFYVFLIFLGRCRALLPTGWGLWGCCCFNIRGTFSALFVLVMGAFSSHVVCFQVDFVHSWCRWSSVSSWLSSSGAVV